MDTRKRAVMPFRSPRNWGENISRQLSAIVQTINLERWNISGHTTLIGSMPRAHEPDQPSQTPHSPICSACGKTMRLAEAQRHPRFVNLDECIFRCDCGEEGEYLMMRPE
jgi:hypothetical protein